jgi:hypothetical protein
VKLKKEKQMPKYKFSESFQVDFEVEADTEAKAYQMYSNLFDKNIKLGFDKWKDVEKKILVGQFEVRTIESEGEEE